jgi:hypothetical protein
LSKAKRLRFGLYQELYLYVGNRFWEFLVDIKYGAGLSSAFLYIADISAALS